MVVIVIGAATLMLLLARADAIIVTEVAFTGAVYEIGSPFGHPCTMFDVTGRTSGVYNVAGTSGLIVK